MERIINVGGRMHSILTGNKTVITADVFDETIDEKQNVINLKTPGFVVEPPSESYFDSSAGYVGYASQNPTEAQMQVARNNISAVSRQELTNAINQIINSGTAGGGSEIVLPISHSWLTAGEDSYSVERGIVAARFAAIENFTNELKGSVITNVYKSEDPNTPNLIVLMKQTKKITRDPNTQAENITTTAEPIVDLSNFARKNNVVSDISYEGNEFIIKKPGENGENVVTISAAKIVSDGGGSSSAGSYAPLSDFNTHIADTTSNASHVTIAERTTWNNKQDQINDLLQIRSAADSINSKYSKPSAGIPYDDLESRVKGLLNKADTSIQSLDGYATTGYVDAVAGGKQVMLNGSLDAPGQNIKSINGRSILYNNIGERNLLLLPYDNDGNVTITGTLTLSSLQPQNGVLAAEGGEVFSDSSIYMKYKGSVQDYETLPGSNGVLIGDTYFVEELNSLVTATSVTQDTNLYVRYPNAGLDIAINTNAEGNTPILQEADFFAAFSNNNEFNNYPTLSYTYHSIYYNGSNVGDLKIVPVRSSEYGIILVLCNISSHKAWAATDVNTGDLNTWYITTPISNNAGIVEIDVIHSTIPTGTNILLLQVFGDGVKWTKPNDTSIKTVNGMSLLGKGNVLITPNNSVYSATGNINSPIITDSTSYDDIDLIINYGFVPVFEDENGYYFHLWKHDTESLESTYEFANWIEDNNSITFKVYSIADAADSTWNSRTISLT